MNTIKDKVSVALAVYNGEKYLPQLLQSLQQQTRQPDEVVVVDDGSSDRSLEIIHEFSFSFPKRVFKNEKNSGVTATFKRLAALCNGDYIAFCDQDDVWLPKKIEQTVSAIKKINSHIPAIVFGDLSVIDEENKLLHQSFWKLRSTRPEKFSLTDIFFGNIVTGCASLINKAMADELTKMPLNVMMYDHWMGLIGYSFGKYSFINEPLILYRAHSSNVTDKHKASFINNFMTELKDKPAYLRKNIQQAIEFKKLYAAELNHKELNALNAFIALGQKPFFYKRVMRDKTSLLRRLK